MVVRTRVCRKHLWENMTMLTQYNNWCILPFKEGGREGGRECAFNCKEEAQYQIQQEG